MGNSKVYNIKDLSKEDLVRMIDKRDYRIAELKIEREELIDNLCKDIKNGFEERLDTRGFNSCFGVDRVWFADFMEQIQNEYMNKVKEIPMKNLKDIILEKRLSSLTVDGRKVPDKYIAVFNDYLKQIAEKLKTHDRELIKEVCEKIREYLRTQVIYCGGKATELDIMIASAGNQVLEDVKQFLDQIQKLEGEDE